MKYKCCEHILGSIDLGYDGFKYCNEVWEGPEYISYTEENAFIKNEERRLEILKNMQNGIIPDKCQMCSWLKEDEWKEFDNKIFKVTIFNWKHCNAACFYCSVQSTFSEKVQKSEYYDSLPIVKKLIDEGRITSDSFIAFMGGEPTTLEEFPEIAKLLIEKGCKIEVLTNGIKYEPVISDLLKTGKGNIVISVDCGSKETYKKIKRVDKYKEVKENIKRYIEEAGENSKKIRIKYIIMPRVNDNKKEIDDWFNFCKETGVRTISRAVNHSDSKMNTKNKMIEFSVINSYNYIGEKAKKLGLNIDMEPWADDIVKNKVYNCRKVSMYSRILSALKFVLGIK